MNTAVMIWLVFRALRWLLWLGFIVYSIHFIVYRENHLDPYGHLLLTTELNMFGLPLAAVFAGYLELMMRERTGLPRPTFGRLVPSVRSPDVA